MTDETAPPAEEPTAGDVHDEEAHEPWVPPATITAPQALSSRLPVEAVLAGVGVAVACSVALWGASQLFYVYILYNALIGGAVGWAVGLGPRRAGFTSTPALVGAAAVLCLAPYLGSRYGFFVQLLPEFRAQGYDPTFFEFFRFSLEVETLFGMELGLFGNSVVLLLEVGISIYYAYSRVMRDVNAARMASVPDDVVRFVVGGLAEGWDTAQLRQELARRGWSRADDQDRAIGTGFDVIQTLQQQAAG